MHIGEPGSGLGALGAGGCLRLCPSQVGVDLKMLKTLADGVKRLLEGDE